MTRLVGVPTCLAFKGANKVNVLGGKLTRLRHGSEGQLATMVSFGRLGARARNT